MTTENMKALLDACYQAKRVRELLPALPKGSQPFLYSLSGYHRGIWNAAAYG